MNPVDMEFQRFNNHKTQRFVFRNGLALEEECIDKLPKTSRASQLVEDGQIFRNKNAPMLKFSAYFMEPSGEGYKSTTRYRKCSVLYYLEDDDIKIYEPYQRNSGFPQGVIVGKGRYPKPEGGYFTLDDLNVGESLLINSQEFKLIDCDEFTRKFLTEMGFKVRPSEPDPPDPITQDRNEMDCIISHKNVPEKKYKSTSFFKHHPQNLRFYGTCEGYKGQFERKQEVTLLYDLSYGTIKLLEGVKHKKDTSPLLRHTLVPKTLDPSLAIGELGSPTILNLAHDVRKVLIGGKYYNIHNPAAGLVDSQPMHDPQTDIQYYKDVDLVLGVPLQIFGFKIVLYDCDEFTRNYYCYNHDKELIPLRWPVESELHPTHKMIYPHQMVGPQEETIREKDLFAPRKDYSNLLHYFKNSRYGYDSHELKFFAQAVTEDIVEKFLRYIITYMLEDGTIKITALDLDSKIPEIREHKHVKRMKIVKPHSKYENTGLCFYQPVDMYVSNVIYVRGRAYKLLEADEYTYDYLERHCGQFPFSNIRYLMSELRELVHQQQSNFQRHFYSCDPERLGLISYHDFKTECVDTDRAYYILRTTHLPLSRDLLKSILFKFPKTNGKVKYICLIDILDWVKNPKGYEKGEPHAIQINWERKETEKNLEKIKFMCFLNDALSTN